MRWAVVEETMGQGSADALMKQHKEQGRAGALVGQTIGVASAVAFEQAVGFHLAQVIAELGEGVAVGGRLKLERIA